MTKLYCGVYFVSLWAIWVVLGDLRGRWLVMLTSRVYLASMQAIWVVLGGLVVAWWSCLIARCIWTVFHSLTSPHEGIS